VGAAGIPKSLNDWLYEKDAEGYVVRELKNLQISFGPNSDSWFATDGVQARWSNLPSGLNIALKKQRKPGGGWNNKPRLVVLGALENYIMITEGHGGSWYLSNYRELKAIIDILKQKDGGFEVIHVSCLSI